MKKCYFQNVRAKKSRVRPCSNSLFQAAPMETSSICEWWVAEFEHERSVVFRCFPDGRGLPKTPEERWEYVSTELDNEADDAKARIKREFKHNPKRGTVVLMAPAQASISSFANLGEVLEYRPACACEVAHWLSSHRTEGLALHDYEELLEVLEDFV